MFNIRITIVKFTAQFEGNIKQSCLFFRNFGLALDDPNVNLLLKIMGFGFLVRRWGL